MNAAAVSAGQFAAAFLLGMGLGAVYELLRPLRPRLTSFSDGLFAIALLYAWIHLSFGICGGDIRFVPTVGLLLGAYGFRLTLGRPMETVVRRLVRPVSAFLKKIWIFFKKLFASGRKSVTIKWTNRRHSRRPPGGNIHGKEKKSIQPGAVGLPPQQAPDQNGSRHSHRTVYGGADLSGRGATRGKKQSRRTAAAGTGTVPEKRSAAGGHLFEQYLEQAYSI